MKQVRLPERMRFVVQKEDSPISGILLRIVFKTNQKNDFMQIFGPSDAMGVVDIDVQDVLSTAK